MSALLSSILLSIVSAVCYAAAAIVQERLAATTAPSRYALLRSGRWWVAVVLNGIGALLHVAALGLGPLTVVQPLGVLTIVIAAPLAAVMVKRPVTATAWRGIALVSVGLAGILVFTGAHESRPLSETEQYAVAGVATAAIACFLAVAWVARGVRRPGVRSVSLAMAAGVAFGTASVCVKAVAEGWALTSIAEALPVLTLVAVFAVTGLATAQASYRGGGLAAPLATATVVNPVVAASVGLLLLEEGFRFGAPGALTALAAAVITGWGLTILTRDSVARVRTPDSGHTSTVVIPGPTAHTGGAGPAEPAHRSGGAPAAPPAPSGAAPSDPAPSGPAPVSRPAPRQGAGPPPSAALREAAAPRIPVPTQHC